MSTICRMQSLVKLLAIATTNLPYSMHLVSRCFLTSPLQKTPCTIHSLLNYRAQYRYLQPSTKTKQWNRRQFEEKTVTILSNKANILHFFCERLLLYGMFCSTALTIQRAEWEEEPWSGHRPGLQDAGEEGEPDPREHPPGQHHGLVYWNGKFIINYALIVAHNTLCPRKLTYSSMNGGGA